MRMPHALLFAGPKGVGKRETAEALAARLLCESNPAPHAPSCGSCASCLLIAAGSHPDFRYIQPEAAEEEEGGEGERKKASKQIRILQIRELETFFHVAGHRGRTRVCLIDPAEAMNAVSANSLLKILEEPDVSFYFIMISHRWNLLLPTLLSRSHRVMFAAPSEAEARVWLANRRLSREAEWLPFFGYAPLLLAEAAATGRLKALATLVDDLMKPQQDPLALAGRWEAHVKADGALTMEDVVTTVQKWLFDLGRVSVGAAPCYLSRQIEPLSALAGRLSLPLLVQAQKQLGQLRAWADHPLNPRLFLEDLLVRAFRPLGP